MGFLSAAGAVHFILGRAARAKEQAAEGMSGVVGRFCYILVKVTGPPCGICGHFERGAGRVCVCEKETARRQRRNLPETKKEDLSVYAAADADDAVNTKIQSKAPRVSFMCSLSPFRVPSCLRASSSSRLFPPVPSHYSQALEVKDNTNKNGNLKAERAGAGYLSNSIVLPHSRTRQMHGHGKDRALHHTGGFM